LTFEIKLHSIEYIYMSPPLVGDEQNFATYCYQRMFQRCRQLNKKCSCPSTPFVLQLDLDRDPARHFVLQSSDLVCAEVLQVRATARCSSCSITKGFVRAQSCRSTNFVIEYKQFVARRDIKNIAAISHPSRKNHKCRPFGTPKGHAWLN